MPAAHKLGQLCSGHGCYPTRPNIEASADVFVNGIGWHREDDAWMIHCCDISCHGSYLLSGSSSVFVNGKEAARIGDPVACGSVCIEGSPDTFAGG